MDEYWRYFINRTRNRSFNVTSGITIIFTSGEITSGDLKNGLVFGFEWNKVLSIRSCYVVYYDAKFSESVSRLPKKIRSLRIGLQNISIFTLLMHFYSFFGKI